MTRGVPAISAIIFAFNLAMQARAESYYPMRMQDFSQICVERFENEGVVNISPVVITVSQNSQISLIGGEAGCLFVYAGPQSISLTFYDPYSPHSKSSWTTTPIYFAGNKGEIASFQLCRARQDDISKNWAKDGWHNMWLLTRVEDKSGKRCDEPEMTR